MFSFLENFFDVFHQANEIVDPVLYWFFNILIVISVVSGVLWGYSKGVFKKFSENKEAFRNHSDSEHSESFGFGKVEYNPAFQQNGMEKQELNERKAQEQLTELFELPQETNGLPSTRLQIDPTKENDCAVCFKNEISDTLKEQYKELISEITMLTQNGLNSSQISNVLFAQTQGRIPVMELLPLIESMMFFMKISGETEKDTGVIGLDPLFEKKSALSSLKRGDYQAVYDCLQRYAQHAESKAEATRRGDVREAALKKAADAYRALGVLMRPFDSEKSLDYFEKSRRFDKNNPITTALLGRVCYEDGKIVQARDLFTNIGQENFQNAYAVQYAYTMLSKIRIQRTMIHAKRIRQEYEKHSDEIKTRQKKTRKFPKNFHFPY